MFVLRKSRDKKEKHAFKSKSETSCLVAGSDKWLCSLTSPYLNLHILNGTGNFKEKKNALFLCRKNLISKTSP